MHRSYRIVFMGTPAFSVPSLQALKVAGHEIVAVYSQPPRPAGRGEKLQKSPVQVFAEAHDLPVWTPSSLKSQDVQDLFRNHKADFAVVVAYGLLLPKAILEAPAGGCLNIHASLLPRWRGAAPIQRALEAGDQESGITLMQMDEGLDTGDILLARGLRLASSFTAETLAEELSHLGAAMIVELLQKQAEGQVHRRPQPREGVTYASKLSRTEAVITWQETSTDLERKVRAFHPWPGLYFVYQGKRIKVLSAEDCPHAEGVPGTLLDHALMVACGKGALKIVTLQKEGKAPMKAEVFLRGTPTLEKGASLVHAEV